MELPKAASMRGEAFQQCLSNLSITPSMSRKANPYHQMPRMLHAALRNLP
jgi:hypothetical protein